MMKTTSQFKKKHIFFLSSLLFCTGLFAQCPGNITVAAANGQCGATVTYTAPGGGTGGQSANGIVNPSAANGLTGWTINQNGGSGWATGEGYFKTSYAMCSKSQVVTLTSLGVTEAYLDTAPAITISDDYIGWESNYSDTYTLTVELRGASNNVIASYSTGNITTSASLQTASHTFTGYGPGVRKVYFSHGGVDVEWWLGNFGAAMTNAQVRVAMPTGGTAVQTAGLPSGSLFPIGTTTNTFQITDSLGNVTNCSFNVIVTDNQDPVVITQPLTVQLDATGMASITASQVNNGSTDNCSIATYALNTTSFDCDNLGNNTVTLTVTDVNGNDATATAVISVEDLILPVAVAQDISVSLNENGEAVIVAEDVNDNSTDNCSIASYSLDNTIFTCEDIGENTVTLTVTDTAGNTSTATATVTVEDTAVPTAIAHGITISLDENGEAVIDAEDINDNSTDNCSIVSYDIDNSVFTCENIGENIVTLTVTDTDGNTATATAVVTVEDQIAPTANAQDITIEVIEGETVFITAEDINDNSEDNCGDVGYGIDIMSFTCINEGENTVTLTVTDSNGNTATDTAIVTVNCAVNGLAENSFKQVKIYPNPTLGPLTISGLNEKVNQIGLYDVSGRLVKDLEVSDTIDISQFEAGVYFIKVSAESSNIIKQIIKQ